MPEQGPSSIEIDFANYCPASSPEEYLQVKVTPSGSVVPQGNVLNEDLRRFIVESVQLNLSLWDGSTGMRGIPYDVQGTLIDQATTSEGIDRDTILRLQYLYRELESTEDSTKQSAKLRRDLETHSKFFNELHPTATLLKEKVATLTKVIASLESPLESVEEGDGGASVASEEEKRRAHSELCDAEEELEPILKAIEKGKRKVLGIREKLYEIETGGNKRLAILERVFSQDPTGELVTNLIDTQKTRERAQRAAWLTLERNKQFTRCDKIMKVHVDAKRGVAHLYALEGALKSIIENLKEAMEVETAETKEKKDDSNCAGAPTSYRLKYVRKLHQTADETLEDVLRYAPMCGIAASVKGLPARGDMWWEDNRERRKTEQDGQFPEKLSRNERKSRPTLLPEFDSIFSVKAFSTKEKIAALYETCGSAYKVTNKAYDKQIEVVKTVLQELNAGDDRLQELERELAIVRGKILLKARV